MNNYETFMQNNQYNEALISNKILKNKYHGMISFVHTGNVFTNFLISFSAIAILFAILMLAGALFRTLGASPTNAALAFVVLPLKILRVS